MIPTLRAHGWRRRGRRVPPTLRQTTTSLLALDVLLLVVIFSFCLPSSLYGSGSSTLGFSSDVFIRAYLIAAASSYPKSRTLRRPTRVLRMDHLGRSQFLNTTAQEDLIYNGYIQLYLNPKASFSNVPSTSAGNVSVSQNTEAPRPIPLLVE